MESQVILTFTTAQFMGLIAIFLSMMIICLFSFIIFSLNHNNYRSTLVRIANELYDCQSTIGTLANAIIHSLNRIVDTIERTAHGTVKE